MPTNRPAALTTARCRRLLSLGHSYTLGVNRRLAHAIQAAGGGRWEVVAAAPTYFHGYQDLRPSVLDATGDEPTRVVPLNAYLTRRVHLFCYGRRLRSLLREGWDLVHMWEEPYILAGYQIAAWTPANIPLVFRTAQSLDKKYPPPFRWMERSVVRRSAGWICSGRTVADNLLRRPGYAEKPMARIPLGVDVGAFRPDPAAGAAARRALGWGPGGPPVVGYLGRFVPEKGLTLLTNALDRLRTPWRALFVGGGPMEADLRAWAARHGDCVRLCTTVRHADVPAYVNAMDVLTAPSQTARHWREQFGRMLIEAFAAGVPVVGSDSGEIPNVIGDAGLVLPEANEAAWVEALGGLLENPGRRAEFAARGLERVGRFSWSSVGRRYVEFFDRLLVGDTTDGGLPVRQNPDESHFALSVL
ncbi:MAG TPA: glycosyltransferase family 4 protein [Gemmataceae bacterium]|nr:glycosyltransferase family 4 protein [Gemmataceae bacterium]